MKAAPPVSSRECAVCGGPAGHHIYLYIQCIIEIRTFRGSSGVCEREGSAGRGEQRRREVGRGEGAVEGAGRGGTYEERELRGAKGVEREGKGHRGVEREGKGTQRSREGRRGDAEE